MSNEVKSEQVVEKKCLCQNEFVRKTFSIALGSFVGVFCALSLFAALHKPPMMHPHFGAYGMPSHHIGCPCQMHRHHHFMHKKPFVKDGNFIPNKPELKVQEKDKD